MSHDDNQIASKMIFAGESLKKYEPSRLKEK